MASSLEINPNRPCWFVNATSRGQDNRSERFQEQGIWEYFEDEVKRDRERALYLKHLKSMKPGDGIAIKEVKQVSRDELGYSIANKIVSRITFSAIGIVTEACKDNKTVGVSWHKADRDRKWYCFTDMSIIWRMDPSEKNWWRTHLIHFAFKNEDQDLERMLKHKEFKRHGYKPENGGAGSTCRSRHLNTILYGPPGTGKTYVTAQRCVEICDGSQKGNGAQIFERIQELRDEGRVEFVTFHESYGYEDFIEGLRPDPEAGSSGALRLVPVPGVLRRIAKRARRSGDGSPYVLVIDEINRANISKVLGELVTLLEEDKREGKDNELAVTLPYSGKKFTLPANLHVLGTMNTADRSIALLDTALRRRFNFKEMPPDPELLKEVDNIDLPNVLRKINERLEWFIDRDHVVGHAWLMGAKTKDDVDLIMREKIIPLIAEYFHEDWNQVRAVLGGGSGFVTRTQLSAPPGDWDDGEPRYSWIVKEEFSPDAYSELINGGNDSGQGSD